MHAPPAVDELKLPVGNQATGRVAAGIVLLFPPPGKEANLDVDEMTVWIFEELVNNSVDDVEDFVEEVLINGHLPPGIIVSEWIRRAGDGLDGWGVKRLFLYFMYKL